METFIFLTMMILAIVVMFGLKKIYPSNSDLFDDDDENDFKFKSGDVVYFPDEKYGIVRKMKINHRMSSWDSDDWEYYHCTCIDPKVTWEGDSSNEMGENVFGESVCEISQKALFSEEEWEKVKKDFKL